MNKTLLAILLAALSITVGIVIATVTNYKFPTDGDITTTELSFTWLNGTTFTAFHWGTIDNDTWYDYDPINITNIGSKNVILTLSKTELSTSIISLSLTWDYTGTILEPEEWVIIEISQKIVATGPYTYKTVITPTVT